MSRKTMLVLCWVGLALGVLALVLVPVFAFAQDTTVVVASPPWWTTLLEVALAFLVPVVTALAGLLIRKIAQHFGAKTTSAQLDMLQQIAGLAVGYAEEYARKKLREQSVRASGNEKLNIAVDYAGRLVQQWGLPQQGAASIVKLVEAALGQGRSPISVEDEVARSKSVDLNRAITPDGQWTKTLPTVPRKE